MLFYLLAITATSKFKNVPGDKEIFFQMNLDVPHYCQTFELQTSAKDGL